MARLPAVRGLNHLTLAVSDLQRSLDFYEGLLGLVLKARWTEGAYLAAGDLWLCLSVDPAVQGASPHPHYTHVAFDVAPDDFMDLAGRVGAAAPVWRENRSEGSSLYVLDPDGHKLELHVGTLQSRLHHDRSNPRADRQIADDP